MLKPFLQIANYGYRDLYGYVNESEEIVISPRFHGALNFYLELAPVKIGELWGYIDTTGELIIPAQFELVIPLDRKDIVLYDYRRWAFLCRQKRAIDNDSKFGDIERGVEWDGMGGWHQEKYFDVTGKLAHERTYWSGTE